MADTIAIRRRIRSVKSTRQITKAMQLVAASKLRTATRAALQAQEYQTELTGALAAAAVTSEWTMHPLVQSNNSDVTRIILLGTDRGLVGAYHSRLEIKLREVVQEEAATGNQVEVVTIGRKEAAIAERQPNAEVTGRYPGPGGIPTIWEVEGVHRQNISDYLAHKVGKVILINTVFHSTLRQAPAAQTLLPLSAEAEHSTVTTLEPDAETAITGLITSWMQAAVFAATTNAYASEQAMQMLAMQNATSNAGDMIDNLTLDYNNARQAAITQELAEISGGVAALEGA